MLRAWLKSLRQSWYSTKRTPIRRQPAASRLRMEALETRTLLDGGLINAPLSPEQVQMLRDGLQGLTDWVGTVGGHGHYGREITLLNRSIGSIMDLSGTFQQGLQRPSSAYLDSANPETDGLVATLQTLSGDYGDFRVAVDPNAVSGGMNQDGTELTFTVGFLGIRHEDQARLNLGSGLANLGLSLSVPLAAGLEAGFYFELTFGLDLTPELEPAQAFFIRPGLVASGVGVDATPETPLGFAGRLGFLSVTAQGGTGTLMAEAFTQINNPDQDPAGRITLSELQNTPLENLVTMTASLNRLDFTLPVRAAIGSYNFPGDPAITLAVEDVFSSTSPTLTTNADFAPLLRFRDLATRHVVETLQGIRAYVNALATFSYVGAPLPGLDWAIGSQLGTLANRFTSVITQLQNQPAATIQEALNRLAPLGPVAITVTPSGVVRLALSLTGQENVARPLNLDLASLASLLPPAQRPILAGVHRLQSPAGSLTVNTGTRLDLNLGIDLSNPASPIPRIFDTSRLELTARVVGTGLSFEVPFGNQRLGIINGTIRLARDNQAGTSEPASFVVGLVPNAEGHRIDQLGVGIAQVSATGGVHVRLPIQYQGNAVGDVELTVGGIANIPGTVQFRTPNFEAIFSSELLQNPQLRSGLTRLVDTLRDGLNGRVLGNLPFLGQGLQNLTQSVGRFLDTLRSTFQQVIDNLGQNLNAQTLRQALRQALLEAFDPPIAIVGDVEVDLSNSDQVQVNLHLRKEVTFNVPLMQNFGFGLSQLGLNVTTGLQAALTFELPLRFGVHRTHGFYFQLDPQQTNDVQVTLNVGLRSLLAQARLGFLRLNVTDAPGADRTQLGGSFSVDVRDPNNDGRLTLAELTSTPLSQLFAARFGGSARIGLNLEVDFGSAEFPSVKADFRLRWDFANQDTTTAMSGVQPTVSFGNVRLALGTFFSRFVSPILTKVREVIGPMKPVLDVLGGCIPVLSQLAGECRSMADFLGQDARNFVTTARQVLAIAESLPPAADNIEIALGGFNIGSTVDVRTQRLSGATPQNIQSVAGALAQLTAMQNQGVPNARASHGFITTLQTIPGAGLRFPILQNPLTVFNLLLDRDVDLFTFEAPTFRVGASFRSAPLPIFPPIFLRLSGGFEVSAGFKFGYDTYGLRTGRGVFEGFFADKAATKLQVTGFIRGEASASIAVLSVGAWGEIAATATLTLNDIDGDGKVRRWEIAANLDLGPCCGFDISGGIRLDLGVFVEIDLFFFSIRKDFKLASIPLVSFSFSCPRVPNRPPELAQVDNGTLTLNMGRYAGRRGSFHTTDGDEVFTVSPVSQQPDGSETVRVTAFGFSKEYRGVRRIVGYGDRGNDTILIEEGIRSTVALEGGDGNDSLIHQGSGMAELHGGMGDDQLIGGSGNDLLYGEGGNDFLLGGPGNDRLEGGDDTGRDTLIGLAGNDTLRGGAGNDQLMGGEGNDLLEGGSGDDQMEGEDGNDTLRGDAGNDRLDGGDGDDSLDGGTENDILLGGAGRDTLQGGLGHDTLRGGADMDTLQGGDGNDQLFGDAGNDVLLGQEGSDTLDGGDGNDTLFGGVGSDVLRGGDGADRLEGGSDSDSLYGGSGDDVLIGGSSLGDSTNDHDLLRGDAGNDLLLGDDVVPRGDALCMTRQRNVAPLCSRSNANYGRDELFGGDGNDTILGGDGDDTLNGGRGQDILEGELGRDKLEIDLDAADGPTMVDQVYGGDHRDTLVIVTNILPVADDVNLCYANAVGACTDIYSGRYRAEWFRPNTTPRRSQPLGAVTFNFIAGPQADIEELRIDGRGGDDFLTVAPSVERDVILDGGEGNDTLAGGRGQDILLGGPGNDLLYGNGGGDELHGGLDNDTLDGGAGNDILYGEENNDRLLGGPDRDELYGGPGNDWLEAGTPPPRNPQTPLDLYFASIRDYYFGDKLYGEAGDDTLIGGPGIDAMYGAAGQDLLVGGDLGDYLDGGDNDVINGQLRGDTLVGETGRDILQGDNGNDELHAYLKPGLRTQLGLPEILPLSDQQREELRRILETHRSVLAPREFELRNIAPAQRTPEQQRELDRIQDEMSVIEHSLQDLRDGQSIQVDTLMGGNGNDTLYGSPYKDDLSGGEGDDWIHYSPGLDTVSGGSGRDTFWVSGTDGNDIITLNAVAQGPNTRVVVVVNGMEMTGQFQNEAANRVDIEVIGIKAGAGNDRVTVQFGENAVREVDIDGEADDDYLDASTAPTDVTLRGGTGNDTLLGGRTHDFLDGGAGNDTLIGGPGNDTLIGGGNNDRLEGGLGYDLLRGDGLVPAADDGNDMLFGDAGNDTLWGGDGNDTLYGGSDQDILDGGAGRDWLDGGDGNDTLSGGAENDTLDGGAGNDRLFGGADAAPVFSDDFAGGPSPLWRNEVGSWVASGGAYRVQSPSNNPPTYTSLPYSLQDFAFEADINGVRDGGIWLRSSDNRNGVLLVTGGYGGTGTGLYWHIGTLGNYGPALNGVSGLFTPGVSNLRLRVEVRGTTYSAFLNGGTTPVTTLTTDAFGTGKVALYGFSTQTFDNVRLSTYNLTDDGNDVLHGGTGADTLDGGTGNDVLFGDAGNDRLGGHQGHDFLYGGDDNDTLDGGDGNDSLAGQGGNDILRGGEGNDWLDGGDGSDLIHGDAGNDSLYGGNGDDVLDGGLGANTLNGGSGADRLYYGQGNSYDGGDGVQDRIVYRASSSRVVVYRAGFVVNQTYLALGPVANISSREVEGDANEVLRGAALGRISANYGRFDGPIFVNGVLRDVPVYYEQGVLTAFANAGAPGQHRIHWSLDGNNLSNGPIRYEGCSRVTAMVAYRGGVLTAFANVSCNPNLHRIHWSADGNNLGGGPIRYEGISPVTAMVVYGGGVLTAFANASGNPNLHRIHWSGDGQNLGGGPIRYEGCSPVTAMVAYGSGVLTSFANVGCNSRLHRIHWSEDGNNLGGGPIRYEGISPVTAMVVYGGGVLTAFANASGNPNLHRIHWSGDGQNLGGGPIRYEGCSPVTAMVAYGSGVLTAFANVGCNPNLHRIHWSGDGNDLGGGPIRYEGSSPVTAMVAYSNE